MEQYLKNFKNCLQKEVPFCAAECPFHLDILDFVEKMKRGGFRGAFKTYRDAVGFPMIASNLCHEPCKGVCPRKASDSAIELGMLEKACISFTADRGPTDYNLPMKKKKIAVIGAGISGLACALRLCMKKYEVEIFESTDRIGGYLLELMAPEVFMADLEEQFKHEKYVIHFNTKIMKPEELSGLGFDAVCAATGDGGEDFGLLSAATGGAAEAARQHTGENRYCAMYDNTGWFAGGGLIGETPVYALANGLYMGTVIDNFLKTGNLLNPENVRRTAMCLDPAKLKYADPAKLKYEGPVVPAKGRGFGEEEAKMEAARCLECQCDFCRTYCDLTDFYNKWPLRIRDEIVATTLPGSADVKATPAKRLLSTCNQCGLCRETCPEEIDLGGLILEGRKSMHRQKKAPWAFHDFWVRDMDFANSSLASIARSRGMDRSVGSDGLDCGSRPAGGPYAFFPGCQLGAGDPGLVEKTYEYLLSRRPDTGLLLRCCGAPAEWSGDEEKFGREIETIYKLWKELGKPVLILACPTCEKKFKTYMTDIPVISLYEILNEWDLDAAVSARIDAVSPQKGAKPESGPKTYSVFDACAARHEEGMRLAVRKLVETVGCWLEPMPLHDAFEQCCSFGGQPGVANPDYAKFVAQKRISESEHPYITYCINCRDVFTDAGKEAVHILDLLFGDGKAPQKTATVSERRENRIRLKRDLLEKYWNTEPEEQKKEHSSKLSISLGLAEKLNRARILEEDVFETLDFCERTGRRVYRPEDGSYSGYKQIGHTTYWVEYRIREPESAPERNGNKPPAEGKCAAASYELINAYAHRMKIELETVWNGRKTDPDM